MSVLSQFFGGDRNNIPLEMLLVSGGGGGGCVTTVIGTAYYGGAGGGGAVEYVNNFMVSPGTVIFVAVGQGGAAAIGPTGTPAANGGNTSVTCPQGTFTVAGGGAGGNFAPVPVAVSAPGLHSYVGSPGGTGGGGYSSYNPTFNIYSPGPFNYGIYNIRRNPAIPILKTSAQQSTISAMNEIIDGFCEIKTVYGFKSGFPSTPGYSSGNYGGGPLAGSSTNSGAYFINSGASPGYTNIGATGAKIVLDNDFTTFEPTGFGKGGNPSGGSAQAPIANSGNGGSGGTSYAAATAGDQGIVIIKWPITYPAAVATTGTVVNRSPATPGFYTYKFTTSGTITLG